MKLPRRVEESILLKVGSKIFLKRILKNIEKYQELRNDLYRARIPISVETYVLYYKSISLFSFIGSFILAFLIYRLKFSYFSLESLLVLSFMTAFIIYILVLASFLIYPKIRQKILEGQLDSMLPFSLLFLSALVRAGVPPQKAFKILSKRKEFYPISLEAKYLIHFMDVLGMDIISAMMKVAETTPSKKFREFLQKFIVISKSGGDLKLFLEEYSKELSLDYKFRSKEFEEKISIIITTYATLMIALPLMLITIFSIISLIIGNLALLDIFRRMFLVIIPVMNVIFIYWVYKIKP